MVDGLSSTGVVMKDKLLRFIDRYNFAIGVASTILLVIVISRGFYWYWDTKWEPSPKPAPIHIVYKDGLVDEVNDSLKDRCNSDTDRMPDGYTLLKKGKWFTFREPDGSIFNWNHRDRESAMSQAQTSCTMDAEDEVSKNLEWVEVK